MSRPLLLDLYCCEGGAALGYHRAGFDIIGVDIVRQPRYPFPFVQADALRLPFDLSMFDAIHASPPCQAYSSLGALWDREHPDLVAPSRDLLKASGLPWVMENVVGAPMDPTLTLCGSSFGLRVRRHRLFESNMTLFGLPCNHARQGTPLGVYGHGGGKPNRGTKATRSNGYEAMGVAPGSMSWHGLTQSIPPAYSEFIGAQLLQHLAAAA